MGAGFEEQHFAERGVNQGVGFEFPAFRDGDGMVTADGEGVDANIPTIYAVAYFITSDSTA